jgi:SAM-dependent methyltransferase
LIADTLTETARLSGRHSARRILDAGCGEGSLAKLLVGRGFAVTGLDIVSELLQEARAINPAEVIFKVGDFRSTPQLFSEKSFDAVVFCMSLNEVHEWKQVLAGAFHTLDKGGRLFILNPHPILSGMLRARMLGGNEWIEYFKPGKFEIFVDKEFGMAHNFHYPLDFLVSSIRTCGGRIESISEPPLPELIKQQVEEQICGPSVSNIPRADSVPWFIFVVARKPL